MCAELVLLHVYLHVGDTHIAQRVIDLNVV